MSSPDNTVLPNNLPTNNLPTVIRLLSAADIDRLREIDQQQHGESWSHRIFADEIERDDRVHLVAEDESGVLGHASAWIDDGSCRVTNVAVAREHAGRGQGSVLLMSLLRTVLAEHRVANVQLEVRPTNRRAQRLYSRFGFMPVGVERNFYDRSDDRGSRDALVMAVPDVCEATWRDRLDQLTLDSQDSSDAGAPSMSTPV